MAASASTMAAANLEQFVLLARSAKGASAAKLIESATAHRGCFVFSELLQQPSIRELKQSEEHAASHRLLELFAYGTLADYNASPSSYPALNAAQQQKLKLLTLVSQCYQSRTLRYADLLGALDVADVRALEDLIIEGIYAGILSGKLDQSAQLFTVEACLGRDVRSAPELERLLAQLQQWSDSAEAALQMLAQRITDIKRSDAARADARKTHDALLADGLQSAARHLQGGAGPGGARDHRSGQALFASDMDVDGDEYLMGRREKKKGSTIGIGGRGKRSRP